MAQYTFTRESGQIETVEPERWQWRAIQNSGQEIFQFDKDFKFHQIKEIDSTAPFLFILYKPGSTTAPIKILIDPSKRKLIYLYKRTVLNAGEENERKITLYVAGYRENHTDHLFVVMPDDSINVLDDINLISYAQK